MTNKKQGNWILLVVTISLFFLFLPLISSITWNIPTTFSGNLTNLSQMVDVSFSGLADNDTLKYDSSSSLWVNSQISSFLTFVNNWLSWNGNSIEFNETKLNATGNSRYVNIDGDNMTGNLNTTGNITADTYFGDGSELNIPLNSIENPDGDKIFSVGGNTIGFKFTNPVGGMIFNWTGAASGHLFALTQTGNSVPPGSANHLLHIDSDDPDVLDLHIFHGGGIGQAFKVEGGYANFTDGIYGSGEFLTDVSTYNETYANFAYNQTLPANAYTDSALSASNASWLSTYNETYAGAINNASYLSTYNETYDNKNSSRWNLVNGNISYSAGNVGIGTTSPNFKLHVRAESAFTNSEQASIVNDAYSTGDMQDGFGPSMNFKISDSGASTHIALVKGVRDGSDTSGRLHFGVKNSGTWNQDAMVIKANGNVGIGTSTPTEKLFVNGSFRVQNSSGTLALYVNESTGNVGIGTTSPSAKLEVNRNGVAGNGITALSGASNAHTSITIGREAIEGRMGVVSGGGEFFGDSEAGGIAIRNDNITKKIFLGAGALSSTLTITNTSVGIGTTSPGAKLQIISPDNSYPTDKVGSLSLRQLGNPPYGWDWVQDANVNGFLHLHRVENSVSTQVMSFDRSTGNVGIGTTGPVSKLDVLGSHSTAALSSSVGSLATFTSDTTVQLQFGAITGGSYAAWIQSKVDGQNAAYPIALQPAGGNVGIGTTSPTRKFSVVESGATHIAFEGLDDSGNAIYLRPNVTSINLISSNYETPAAAYLPLALSGRENTADLYLSTSGNVGIGTTSPNAQLHVSQEGTGVRTAQFDHTHATNPVGIEVRFTPMLTDNTHFFFTGSENAGANNRISIYSDGDVYNKDGTYGTISDERLKSSIISIAPQIEKINQIQVRNFEKFDTIKKQGASKNETGFIAQELELIYPEVVSDIIWNNESVKAINTVGLIPHLVKAIQELFNWNTNQDETISKMNTTINNQELEIASLSVENSIIKSELCKKDMTYGWCVGVKGI
jgi:hypothetical protein